MVLFFDKCFYWVSVLKGVPYTICICYFMQYPFIEHKHCNLQSMSATIYATGNIRNTIMSTEA